MNTPSTRRDFLRYYSTAAMGAAALRLTLPSTACAQQASPPYKLGCYTRPWDQHEYTVALDAIAQAGFRYAGLMTGKGKTSVLINADTTLDQAAKMGAEAKMRGLEILSIWGGFQLSDSADKSASDMKRIIDNCAACGAPNMLLGGISKEDQYDPYFKAIAAACDHAAGSGVVLAIKPHGGQNATGPQCRKAIEMVGHPNFRLMYDPGNIFYYSDGALDPVDDSTTVNGLVCGLIIKDFRAPKEVMLTPGTGLVNFPAVLKNLKAGGFTAGPVIVECLTRGGDLQATTAEARKAYDFATQLIAS